MRRIFLTIITFMGIVYSTVALGSGEKIWELAGEKELKRGELENVILSSRGEIVQGITLEKIDLEAVGMVWSMVRDAKGTVYLGTGYDGKIYRVDGNKANLIATTDTLVITDMIFNKAGDLFVSTLPDASILKVSSPRKINPQKPVKAMLWAKLPEGEYIWSLAYNKRKQIVYAGSGPQGKLWAIGRDGKPNVFFDSDEEHILDVVVDENGDVLAGTSPSALLLKVSSPGAGFAIADFDATEVKQIAQAQDGAMAVAVNSFSSPRKVPSKKNSTSKKKTSTKLSSKDKGMLYWVTLDGASELLIEKENTHLVSLGITEKKDVYAGFSTDGKVIWVNSDRVVHELANVSEREVMSLLIDRLGLSHIATGDSGGAYFVSNKKAASYYLSPVLDAQNIATFGAVNWFSSDGKVEVVARTGNTILPNATWTEWSPLIKNGKSPMVTAARFIQFKVSLKNVTSRFLSLELSYKPKNRRAVITKFNPDTPFSDTRKTYKGKLGASTRTIALRPEQKNKKELTLTWSTSNPDKDNLRFRLYYKPIDKHQWIPIFKEDYQYKGTRYTWNTEMIPEGTYHLKLVADDSLVHAEDDVLQDMYISVPVQIDNHPPTISVLLQKQKRIYGTVSDTFSKIASIEYSVDGGLWQPINCKDKLLDSVKESFEFSIEELEQGAHVIAVRVFDRNGNYQVKELHVEIK